MRPDPPIDPPWIAELEPEEREFQLAYGRWVPLRPSEVRALFDGARFRWWIAGGWAVDAVTGVPRFHGDTDIAVLRDDVAAVRGWLTGYHVWEVNAGALRLPAPAEEFQPDSEQLWIRRDSTQPWLADLLLTPSRDGRWLFKRDDRISMPLEELGHEVDGVRYLRPHVVLLHKARSVRPKDESDFDALRPLLTADEARWLDEALALAHPDHPWRARLG